MTDVGGIEGFIHQLKNGGWEMFEQLDDTIEKATGGHRKTSGLTEEDRRTIAQAWSDFEQTPGGRMALQALVDRTLNKSVFITHLGLSAEQVAITGAAREGQNFVVQLILNQIRIAREEPQKQRDVT